MTETMAAQSALDFTGRNPDVLSCIANLSSDEVFTPPELANQMLDLVEQAWAESHSGASIWADSAVTFLDPFTKTGVFLREITKRLVDGLAETIPDLTERVDHILTKQVYGIGITELTALLARRSLYCSKWADGEHSIATSFDNPDGNIWFERTEHTWVGGTKITSANKKGKQAEKTKDGRCKFCGTSQTSLDRGSASESHAYAFIHTDNIKTRITELFGDGMQFDVIIGNPPYQLDDGGFGSSAAPIYHHFVEVAKQLKPRVIAVVIPARWYAGGKGLNSFRTAMLEEGGIRSLHDFPNTSDAFPGVNIRGGVCYFAWDRDYDGDVSVSTHEAGKVVSVASRPLLEPGLDTFIRYNEGVSIMRKVAAVESSEKGGITLPLERSFASIVSSRKPFGIDTTFTGHSDPKPGDILIYRNGGVCYAASNALGSGESLLNAVKLFVPYASPGSDDYPHLVLSRPILSGPGEAATETYLAIGPFDSMREARNAATYMGTCFFRFMVNLLRVSQHVTRGVYRLAPLQDFSRPWLDDDLAARYGLTNDDRAFMARFVKSVSWAEDYL